MNFEDEPFYINGQFISDDRRTKAVEEMTQRYETFLKASISVYDKPERTTVDEF
jgi:hypothetical protein